MTVALEDLNKTAYVSCIIRLDGKPIGKGSKLINGVGTISIILPMSLRKKNVTAECSQEK